MKQRKADRKANKFSASGSMLRTGTVSFGSTLERNTGKGRNSRPCNTWPSETVKGGGDEKQPKQRQYVQSQLSPFMSLDRNRMLIH